ncbi:MAG: hypothetical protein ACYTAF_12160, partial [Planctomycetota bacterium]
RDLFGKTGAAREGYRRAIELSERARSEDSPALALTPYARARAEHFTGHEEEAVRTLKDFLVRKIEDLGRFEGRRLGPRRIAAELDRWCGDPGAFLDRWYDPRMDAVLAKAAEEVRRSVRED